MMILLTGGSACGKSVSGHTVTRNVLKKKELSKR